MHLHRNAPPGAAEARCYLCPHNDGQFVNTARVIDGEGILSLCERCVAKMARLIGWPEPGAAEAAGKAVQILEAGLAEANLRIATLESALRHSEELAALCSTLFPQSSASAGASAPVSSLSQSPSKAGSVQPKSTKPRS